MTFARKLLLPLLFTLFVIPASASAKAQDSKDGQVFCLALNCPGGPEAPEGSQPGPEVCTSDAQSDCDVIADPVMENPDSPTDDLGLGEPKKGGPGAAAIFGDSSILPQACDLADCDFTVDPSAGDQCFIPGGDSNQPRASFVVSGDRVLAFNVPWGQDPGFDAAAFDNTRRVVVAAVSGNWGDIFSRCDRDLVSSTGRALGVVAWMTREELDAQYPFIGYPGLPDSDTPIIQNPDVIVDDDPKPGSDNTTDTGPEIPSGTSPQDSGDNNSLETTVLRGSVSSKGKNKTKAKARGQHKGKCKAKGKNKGKCKAKAKGKTKSSSKKHSK